MRDPDELRDQSFHVLWSVRQLLALAAHLDDRAQAGEPVMTDPLDAAALEAFCVHARALIEFLWRDRSGRTPGVRKDDAVSADWFEGGVWPWMQQDLRLPPELTGVEDRTGWGLAHLTYKRLRPETVAGWDHVGIANRIAYFVAGFAEDVDPSLVGATFKAGVYELVMAWRFSRPRELFPPPRRVATPGSPSAWSVRPLSDPAT
jgi:hypothetical protein